MIPLLRKPVMEFLIEHLAAHGVRDIVVNTSHLAPVIEQYFRDGDRHGVQIAYSFEGSLERNGGLHGAAIGSAGGMRRIQDFSGFFDETFVVLCGDALVDVDLSRVLEFHKSRNAIATIVLRDVPRDQVSRYGVVQTDSTGHITRFQEKPKVEEAVSTSINSGIYLFEPEVFDYVPAGMEFDIGGQLLPALAALDGALYGIAVPFTWVDIGSIPDYWEATQLLLSGAVEGFTMPGREVRPGIHAGINLRVNWDRVDITGPVFIGSSTSVGDGAIVHGPSVVGAGCVIEPGAVVDRCVLSDYTRVSSAAVLENKLVFGNHCIDPSGQYLDIAESQIGWLVEDARLKVKLSDVELQLIAEVQSLVARQ